MNVGDLPRIVGGHLKASGQVRVDELQPLHDAKPADAARAREVVKEFIGPFLQNLVKEAEADPGFFGPARSPPTFRFITGQAARASMTACCATLTAIPSDRAAELWKSETREVSALLPLAFAEALKAEGLVTVGYFDSPGYLGLTIYSPEVAQLVATYARPKPPGMWGG